MESVDESYWLHQGFVSPSYAALKPSVTDGSGCHASNIATYN